jgi:hypothetical protein
MKDQTEDGKFYDYNGNPYYTLDNFFGAEAYFATAYFVDMDQICDGGRTEEEFLEQGTGYRLTFQSGPHANDLEFIPLTQAAMDDTVSIRHHDTCFGLS